MAGLRLLFGMMALAGSLGMPLMAEAKGCGAVNDACAAAGFTGDATIGQGTKIIRDCMMPLLNGIAPPGNGKLPLPTVTKAPMVCTKPSITLPRGCRVEPPASTCASSWLITRA